MRRNFLAYGVGISIALHALLLPLVHAEKTLAEEPPPDHMIVEQLPTPPPTPPPTPRPTSTPTPPPREKPHTPASQAPQLRIVAPHADARTGGTSEPANTHLDGDPNGDPSGTRTAAPAAGDTPATPGATPTPRPTPTPLSCARPEVPAATVRAAEPDTPALAQQQGISGTVQIVVSLDVQSRIVATRVASSPSGLLNAAALAAARGSQFRTGVHNCEPVAADYIFSVEFNAQ